MMDDVQVESIFKEAIMEVMQEHRNFFFDLFVEAIEDIAMIKAIEEGEESEIVSRERRENL
jgi:hypothetical protein